MLDLTMWTCSCKRASLGLHLEFMLQCPGQQILSDSVVVRNNFSYKKPHNLIDDQVFYSFSRFCCSAYITFCYIGVTLTREMLFVPFEHNSHIIFSPLCNIL